ncbi:MAG: hypothetical protein AAGF47_12600, partial [Planctomycetota bacterium]
ILTIAHNAGELGLSRAALVGMLTPICLAAVGFLAWAVWSLRPGAIAVGVFAMVCLQGMLGALRVTEISPAFGTVHGVMAQLILGATAVLAARLSGTWPGVRSVPAETAGAATGIAKAAAAAFICLLIQLSLAALFRHTGAAHALWTHVGFSLFAMIALGVLGFSLQRADAFSDGGRVLRRIGTAVIACTVLQMSLGFVAWAVVGDGGGPERVVMHDELSTAADPNILRTIFATSHQANGALLMGLTWAAWAWASGVVRAGRGSATAQGFGGST